MMIGMTRVWYISLTAICESSLY